MSKPLTERLRDIAKWMEDQRWCAMTPSEWEAVSEAATALEEAREGSRR